MKKIQKLETITALEQEAFEKLEIAVAATEESAICYCESLGEIRDRRLYRAQFPTFALYCETRWGKSYRAINLALQADKIRKGLKWEAASHLSDKAAISLDKVAPEFQKEVLKEATKSPTGATSVSIKRAAKKFAPSPSPARGGFASYTDQPDDTSAYTSAPAPVEPRAEVFGGDQEAEEAGIPSLTDPDNTALWLEAFYSEHQAWFNELNGNIPKRFPRQLMDRLIEGTRE